MPHFKDQNNKVYYLDNEDVEDWTQEGWIQIEDAEAEQLRAPTLDQLKTYRLWFLKEKRDAAATASIVFKTQGGIETVFQANENSTSALLLAYSALPTRDAENIPSDFFWVAEDNSQIPFTLQDIGQLLANIQNQRWQSFKKFQQLRQQLSDAKTVEDIVAIYW